MLEEHARRLALGLPGDPKFDYVDRYPIQKISIVNRPFQDQEPVFELIRRLDFTQPIIDCERTFVRRDHRRLGIDNTMMTNTMELASELRFGSVKLYAVNDGRYIWAKAKFAPSPEAWRGKIRQALVAALEVYSAEISTEYAETAWGLVESEDPSMITALAELAPVVRLRDDWHDVHGDVSLGYALLTSVPSWHGTRMMPTRERRTDG